MFSGSAVNHTPKDFTLFVYHLKFLSGRRISFFPLFVPIHIASVFLLLSLRPEASPKSSSVLRAAENDDCEPFNIKVVSSAYWLILISSSSTYIPLILLFLLKALAKTSTERTNRYADKGHPCLTPVSILKKLLVQPLFKKQLFMLL